MSIRSAGLCGSNPGGSWYPRALVDWSNTWHARRKEPARIGDGVDAVASIVTAKGADAVSPDKVAAIVGYKLDELTADLICCDIVTGAGKSEQIRTIHEELPGFDAVMAL